MAINDNGYEEPLFMVNSAQPSPTSYRSIVNNGDECIMLHSRSRLLLSLTNNREKLSSWYIFGFEEPVVDASDWIINDMRHEALCQISTM